MYEIRRFYQDPERPYDVIRNVATLEEAQAHCNDPETSSSTATSQWAQALTEKVGSWFDGYEEV